MVLDWTDTCSFFYSHFQVLSPAPALLLLPASPMFLPYLPPVLGIGLFLTPSKVCAFGRGKDGDDRRGWQDMAEKAGRKHAASSKGI